MDELNGRGAVVIGGGSGIGRGIVLALGTEGMRVLVADIDADSAAGVRDEVIAAGGTALSAHVDATDREALAGAASQAAEDLGTINLLVHMVGVNSDASVVGSSEATWSWFTEFNLMAAVRVVDTFVPLLREHGEEAHIVVTASMAGLVSLPIEMGGGFNLGLYTVLKHAMVGYGEMLRHDLAKDGIGVSVLCPGVVNTNLDVTSARNRPDRLGGPMPTPAELDLPTRMQPEAVGPIVVRGVRANRPYIFTHPERIALFNTYTVDPVTENFEFYADAAPT